MLLKGALSLRETWSGRGRLQKSIGKAVFILLTKTASGQTFYKIQKAVAAWGNCFCLFATA